MSEPIPDEDLESFREQLIATAELEHAEYAWGREGPKWGTFVYFYTDYENDDVKVTGSFAWPDHDVAKKAFDIILQGLS